MHRRTGIRGETYGYWYLRKRGYVFVGKSYVPLGAKGEIAMIAYDGKTFAFVEVRTRTPVAGQVALPELKVTKEKQRVVIRSAQHNEPPFAQLPLCSGPRTGYNSTNRSTSWN